MTQKVFTIEEREKLIRALVDIDGCADKAMQSLSAQECDELIESSRAALKILYELGVLDNQTSLKDLQKTINIGHQEYEERFTRIYEDCDSLIVGPMLSQLSVMPLSFLMNYGEMGEMSLRFVKKFLPLLLERNIDFTKAQKNKIQYMGADLIGIITNTALLDAMLCGYLDLTNTLIDAGFDFETVVEVDIKPNVPAQRAIKNVMAIEAALMFFKANTKFLSDDMKQMSGYLTCKLEEINIAKERLRLMGAIELNCPVIPNHIKI